MPPLIIFKNPFIFLRKHYFIKYMLLSNNQINIYPLQTMQLDPLLHLISIFLPNFSHVPSSSHRCRAATPPIAMATKAAKSGDSSQYIQQTLKAVWEKKGFLHSPYFKNLDASSGSAQGNLVTGKIQNLNFADKI